MTNHIIIPASMASSRLPGKPMVELLGTPMIGHTLDRAAESDLADEIHVAHDGHAQLRSYLSTWQNNNFPIYFEHVAEAKSGTERAAKYVAKAMTPDPKDRTGTPKPFRSSVDIVVVLQCDEPCLPGWAIDILIRTVKRSGRMATLAISPSRSNGFQVDDPDSVKVVADRNDRALWFSRKDISTTVHIGAYAMKPGELLRLRHHDTSHPGERLEQLAWLEWGEHLLVDIVDGFQHVSVNREGDIALAEQELRKLNSI